MTGDLSANLPPARSNKISSESVEQSTSVKLLLMGLKFIVFYDGPVFSNVVSGMVLERNMSSILCGVSGVRNHEQQE